ncbi:hypothetical protein P8452_18794 [Trifolium repens]|nr:hypothetical protein P8452_18794 [Trifolium repens]
MASLQLRSFLSITSSQNSTIAFSPFNFSSHFPFHSSNPNTTLIFLPILCGIEMIDNAFNVFAMIKTSVLSYGIA